MNNYRTYNHIFFILFVFVLAVIASSCNDSESNSVYIAEGLLESRPDSALMHLEYIDFPEDLPNNDYAKYCQLLVMVHQKNKITIKNDTCISYSVDYYKDKPEQQVDYMKSLLLLGSVYEERGDLQQAVECYQDVFNQSKKLRETELHGISAFETGGLYKSCGRYKKSIEWFNIAANTFKENDSQVMRRRCMRQIADCFVLSGQTDTALVIYNKVLSEIPLQRINVKAEVYKNIAITYKKGGYYDESLRFIKLSVQTANNESLYPLQYLIQASIYQNMGKIDSSMYYNQEALRYAKKLNDLGLIHKAYDAMYEVDSPQEFDNYILSRSETDSIYQKQKYESVKFQRLYNVEKIKSRNKELTIKIQYYVFLLLSSVLILIISYLYQRNNKIKKQVQLKSEIETKNNIIISIRDSLYQRYLIYKRMIQLSISPNKDKHKAFLKEYNKILFNKENEVVFDWNIIYDFGNHIFENYIEKLNNSYTQLNDMEKNILILQKMGFSITEIATILGKSIHTLYKYSSNIRKNLNIHESDSVIDFIDAKLKNGEEK